MTTQLTVKTNLTPISMVPPHAQSIMDIETAQLQHLVSSSGEQSFEEHVENELARANSGLQGGGLQH